MMTIKTLEQNLEELVDLYDTDIGEDDYGFVIGPNGELKSVFLPPDTSKVPKKVKRLLKIFGVHDIDQLNGYTLH